jgi:hypothetical protein
VQDEPGGITAQGPAMGSGGVAHAGPVQVYVIPGTVGLTQKFSGEPVHTVSPVVLGGVGRESTKTVIEQVVLHAGLAGLKEVHVTV